MTPDQLAKSGTEHAEQRALFAWCNMAERYGVMIANNSDSYTAKGFAEDCYKRNTSNARILTINQIYYYKPIAELKWLHAIHNQGHGDAIRGARAKAEGVKAGVADLFLPVPIYFGGTQGDIVYCGLYIEMKRADKGKLSIEQNEFARDMQSVGYKWVCCFGWKNARDEILKYLGLS